YLPGLLPTDVLYACGAPGMVESIKSIAAHVGAVCYADPFLPTNKDPVQESVLARAIGWLPVITTRRQMDQLVLDRSRNLREPPMQDRARNRREPPMQDRSRSRREPSMQAYRMAEARVGNHYR